MISHKSPEDLNFIRIRLRNALMSQNIRSTTMGSLTAYCNLFKAHTTPRIQSTVYAKDNLVVALQTLCDKREFNDLNMITEAEFQVLWMAYYKSFVGFYLLMNNQ